MSRGWKTVLIVLLSVAVLAGGFVAVQLLRPVPDAELTVDAARSYTFPGGEPELDWPEEGQAAIATGDGELTESYGEQQPSPIASVAKVMTAYIILRDHPLSEPEQIEVDERAEQEARQSVDTGESVVWVTAGETMDQRQAVQALMIASGNNVARLLARWDAGSEQAFVEKMNRTAEELGMGDTTYTDPSGLADETVSTAVDQVKLARAAMQIDAFREIVAQPEYTHSDGTVYRTWNSLLGTDGVIGIKTGTTTPAGGNLLFAAEQDEDGRDQLVVGAVFGQHREPRHDTVITQTRELLDATWTSLGHRTVVPRGETVGVVTDDFDARIPVVTEKAVGAVGWPGHEVSVKIDTDRLPSSAPAGTRVGTLTVGEESSALVLKRPLHEPGLSDRLVRGF